MTFPLRSPVYFMFITYPALFVCICMNLVLPAGNLRFSYGVGRRWRRMQLTLLAGFIFLCCPSQAASCFSGDRLLHVGGGADARRNQAQMGGPISGLPHWATNTLPRRWRIDALPPSGRCRRQDEGRQRVGKVIEAECRRHR
jgi:hypothetical protein